jgi:type VI secretion system protein ImpA
MNAIDVDKLLQPISDDQPCGPNLEYDAEFLALGRSALPQSDGAMVEGKRKAPPESPKWREIASAAETLLDRTKDLRVAMYLTNARLNTHGLPGLADGMALIKGLLTGYWDAVYPQLDAEENNDPTLRVNSLDALGDVNGIVGSLREIALVQAKRAGQYSLRDIRMATGELSPSDGAEAPDMAVIDAAFLECELDSLQQSAAAAGRLVEDIRGVEAYITSQVGADKAPNFKLLQDEVSAITGIYAEKLSRRGVDTGLERDMVESNGGAGVTAASGEIRSREDATRMLDKISEYFRRNEPSSPVPILLQRAKGLIAKDFMEILRDLTPEGIKQAEMFSRSKADD